ncbi:MAG: NAD(P)H-hydrate dehydratase [Pseudomonadota bacterium]|nr:NAD(P)H-hydrate dehydratase [Pseudomonadota bacterium]
MAHASLPIDIDQAMLHAWPLPMPSPDSDKEGRGHVLIVGGSREMPGAVILAATAALRAGAGKLTIATGRSVAQLVALALPEARVIGLAETDRGGFSDDAATVLAPLAGKIAAILVGPGMQDEDAAAALVHALLAELAGNDVSVILDACAMATISCPPDAQAPFRFAQPVVVTPHAGEMAHLSRLDKDAIHADVDRHAHDAAARWNAVVALKGARTVVAAPDGTVWQHVGGNIGLATSGSGDTLAGIIAGLAARGATLEQATCWGVALHALAGQQLALRFGQMGYLAREIPAEIPALLEQIGATRSDG